MQKERIKKFQKLVWDFYQKNKREFAWRKTRDPYKILVSEIMLQQTQADRVIRFYEKWINRFPNFKVLASAKFSEIYPFWQGLGYNRRALALKRAAEKSVKEFDGKLPAEIEKLEEFPGIGPYTARAISIFSFNTPVACIETNIRRVFIHHFFAEKISRKDAEINPSAPLRASAETRGKKINDEQILEIAQRALPAGKARQWHWALMDYGAYLKSTVPNPNRRHKNYNVQSKFEGSLRQIRGTALKILSAKKMDCDELVERLKKATLQTKERIKKVILALEKEGLIKSRKKIYSLK
ncbi:MAG: hypothetical protein A3D44_03545 [Candidatus Staskawiczbacteria bacterium RIFCSPHIGHO2_02_FULL_42_22]|uniref:HhH-GPD domain-containing protein n=1 Tax=Candidatus Staskawiczbacteria bacterium RIFCSPHIGHO2_02_FULL_42_22 TaxID=1802207 RepID=A0A1G2I4X3_9BACT|nr:MAG: hypothetical protein A3D44_03545 [Candidatus Staskawiczbacteria bacterium RIFCSPHIGHO2_02_FULL_42_22]